MRHTSPKCIVTLLFILAVFAERKLVANPGDTTWVTVFNLKKLDHHGNYDTTSVFPTGKTYRKIRMHYILGRYACPAGTQYCGSWDYTTMIHARPKGKDTVEIGRVITPYATDWLNKNKKHDYILDVTDYASVLQDTTGMRFRYEGYSWGFTITLKIEFIEGTPPMEAKAVENIYDGYFAYGVSANPIESKLVPTVLTYTTPRAYIKNTVSGHGSDNAGCAEFCNRWYQLHIDNAMQAQRQLWRSDCGVNHVYPQTGTWLFNRGNWCPGAIVEPIYHDLEWITAPSASFTADINMQPHTASSNPGGYNFVTQLISYSAPNHQVDASIEDIATPTFDENHFRDNPACMNPRIRLKNTGALPLNFVTFTYGLTGLTTSTFTWAGDLKFLEDTIVEFPPSVAIMSQTTSLPFEVRIVEVNGNGLDENVHNDVYRSATRPVQKFPPNFVIMMSTNNSLNMSTNKNQTTWKIFDQSGAVVASRANMNNNSAYFDTLTLADGCYRMIVEDAGCDGFSWWYYQYYTPNPGSGSIKTKHNGLPTGIHDVDGDFGCNVIKSFVVGSSPPPPPPPPPPDLTSLTEWEKYSEVGVYPSPAGDEAFLQIYSPSAIDINCTMTDISGRIVMTRRLNDVTLLVERFDTQALESGVYLLKVEGIGIKPVSRKLVVQK